MTDSLMIATRRSPLALWQAEHVQALLRQMHPQLLVELLPMSTEGDRRLNVSLAAIGGKGLFIKELEQALLNSRAQLAVHSMKDVPAQLPPQFSLAAIMARASPFDALVGPYESIDKLPRGARVGTSSLRRQTQLLAHRPDLVMVPVRGNVGTRLSRLEEGVVDALVLAQAGLERLGLSHRMAAVLPPELSLPAAGQGALALEISATDEPTRARVQDLHDADTAACVQAERRVVEKLGGGCTMPLGAFALLHDGGQVWLRAKLVALDGAQVLSAEAKGAEPISLGDQVADDLMRQGALELLRAVAAQRSADEDNND